MKFVVDDAFAYLPQFARLYNSTMDKLSADGFYYFNDAYYRSLKERIDNKFLGVVKLEEEVLSAAIFSAIRLMGITICQAVTRHILVCPPIIICSIMPLWN